MMSAVAREEGFVEQELVSGKGRELRIAVGGVFQAAEKATAVAGFCAGEGHVRVVGAILGGEATLRGGGNDLLLEGVELWRDAYVGEEHSGPIEDASSPEPYRNCGRSDLTEPGHSAFVDGGRRFAEELERDMPGIGRTPAQPVRRRAKTSRQAIKRVNDFGRQRDSDEEPHDLQMYFAKDSICFNW